MTIFKEILDEEYLTISEVKRVLDEIEAERALDEEREMRYELTRAVEHVDRFGVLDPEDTRALAEELHELEKVTVETAFRIADLLPEDRNELRAVFAKERYALDGDELDEILDVVARYA